MLIFCRIIVVTLYARSILQYALLQSRCKGHFGQNNIIMPIIPFLILNFAHYSSIITLNSFSHLFSCLPSTWLAKKLVCSLAIPPVGFDFTW